MRYFLEIGSCDFDTLNDFADHGWSGVIVEPIDKYLNSLDKKSSIKYYNCAIDSTSGARDMYIVSDDLVDRDHDFAGMSSFYEPHGNPHFKKQVPTKSYAQLIEDSNITAVDYLKIDTEGHDWVILQQVTLQGRLRPKYIKIEHKHCDSSLMANHLSRHGYRVFVLSQDIWAMCESLIVSSANP
jgi:FkbM family methyltransferase